MKGASADVARYLELFFSKREWTEICFCSVDVLFAQLTTCKILPAGGMFDAKNILENTCHKYMAVENPGFLLTPEKSNDNLRRRKRENVLMWIAVSPSGLPFPLEALK